MLEYLPESDPVAIIKRLLRQIPKSFRGQGVELFCAFKERDLDVCEMLTGPFLYMRSTHMIDVARISLKVRGLQGTLNAGDEMGSQNALPVDDTFVQSLILQSKKFHEDRSRGIGGGSFVRIMSGDYAYFCGTVLSLDPPVVELKLRSKRVTVTTQIDNLLCLDHVARREYFYDRN